MHKAATIQTEKQKKHHLHQQQQKQQQKRGGCSNEKLFFMGAQNSNHGGFRTLDLLCPRLDLQPGYQSPYDLQAHNLFFQRRLNLSIRATKVTQKIKSNVRRSQEEKSKKSSRKRSRCTVNFTQKVYTFIIIASNFVREQLSTSY